MVMEKVQLKKFLKREPNGGGCACVGAGSIDEISVYSVQFCCEPQIALKITSLKKKKQIQLHQSWTGNRFYD